MKQLIVFGIAIIIHLSSFAQESLSDLRKKIINKEWVEYKRNDKTDVPAAMTCTFVSSNKAKVNGKDVSWTLKNDPNKIDTYLLLGDKKYLIYMGTDQKTNKTFMRLSEIAMSKGDSADDIYLATKK
ncbi:hypothetical protein D3C80_1073930 [compost metagenome]